jgi:hypothetical protein
MTSIFSQFEPISQVCRRIVAESTSLMDDAERRLYYLDQIKRLKRLQSHFAKQPVARGQGYANFGIANTIEKYEKEVARIEAEQSKASQEEEKGQQVASVDSEDDDTVEKPKRQTISQRVSQSLTGNSSSSTTPSSTPSSSSPSAKNSGSSANL